MAPRYTTEPCTTSNERGEAKWGRVAGLYNSSNSLTPESSNTSSWLSSCGKHLHTECGEALAAICRVPVRTSRAPGKLVHGRRVAAVPLLLTLNDLHR